MKLLRILRFVVLASILMLLMIAVLARFSDGPIAIFAGGPLSGGTLVTDAEPDWQFVHDVSTVELQLMDPPRSRTTWILEDNGRIYIPCGYMESRVGRWWKKWPIEAEKDGRSMLRVDGTRYPRQLVRTRDPELFDRLTQQLEDKYGVPASEMGEDSDSIWFFQAAPPRGET